MAHLFLRGPRQRTLCPISDFKVDVDGVEIADEDFLVGQLEITDTFFNNEQGIFYLLTVDCT